jgi:hypothetical protein
MLEALAHALAGFAHVVTYNGKLFDVPLLEARFRLNRVPFPLAAASHLDLLHPARRLWKLRLESCRLQSLESALLGVARRGDIPGEEIPRAYFRYVRSRDPAAVGRIFEHNRVDIVSLAALLALACQWIDETRAEDARDVFSLARVLERAQRYERSQVEYRRTLRLDPGPLRAPALMRLAAHAKRGGDAAGAALLWEEAAREGATARRSVSWPCSTSAGVATRPRRCAWSRRRSARSPGTSGPAAGARAASSSGGGCGCTRGCDAPRSFRPPCAEGTPRSRGSRPA